jgi:hypothetical protein
MALSAGEIAVLDARASSVGERIGWEMHFQVAPNPELRDRPDPRRTRTRLPPDHPRRRRRPKIGITLRNGWLIAGGHPSRTDRVLAVREHA